MAPTRNYWRATVSGGVVIARGSLDKILSAVSTTNARSVFIKQAESTHVVIEIDKNAGTFEVTDQGTVLAPERVGGLHQQAVNFLRRSLAVTHPQFNEKE